MTLPIRFTFPGCLVAVLFLHFSTPAYADPEADPWLQDRARAIHESVLTLDTHIDIPANYATHELDPGTETALQVDLPKMLEGGLDSGFFIVFVRQGPLTGEGYASAYDAAIAKFDAINRQSTLYGHVIGLARTPGDVDTLSASGKLVAMIGLENGYSLGANMEHIAEFHDRGARYMSLTHMGNTQFGDSSGGISGSPEPLHGGLSPLGFEAIGEMNRLGVMIDVSHAAKTTTLQAVKASKAPVIASHSAVQKFRDIPRNISRKEMKAIAKRGGVVQVVAFDAYLKEAPAEKATAISEIREDMGLNSREAMQAATPDQWAALRERVRALDETWPRANVADFVDQIDYAVKVMGIDHVGIASDFGGGGGINGWDSADETFNITLELVRRGYGEREISKIWSGNLLRVWREVEIVAARIQAQEAE
jgi:membrane dipeptidase